MFSSQRTQLPCASIEFGGRSVWLVLLLCSAARAFCPYAAPGGIPVPDAVLVLAVPNLTSPLSYTLPLAPDANTARRRLASATFTVDWGDGNTGAVCTNNGAPCSHTYTTGGTYTLRLAGAEITGWSAALVPETQAPACADTIQGWYDMDGEGNGCAEYRLNSNWGCDYPGHADFGFTMARQVCCGRCGGGALVARPSARIREVQAWGGIRLHTTSGYHFQGTALVSLASPLPASPGLRSLAGSFGGLASLGSAWLDVGSLDTSLVTDLTALLQGAPALSLAGLGNWDTSNVVNASYAFEGNLGTLAGTGAWNVGSLRNAEGMFRDAAHFDEDLSGWQPAQLESFGLMFFGASAFRGRGVGAWSLGATGTQRGCEALFFRAGCDPSCPRPQNCQVGAFKATLQITQSVANFGLYTRKPGDSNAIRVDWGNGQGWVQCQQEDSNPICAPSSLAVGTYHIRIEGRVAGLVGFTTGLTLDKYRLLGVWAWGNVTMASPNGWVGTLFAEDGMYAQHETYVRHLEELVFLPPGSSTRAVDGVTNGVALMFSAYKLVGDLRDWRPAITGETVWMFRKAYRFNQDLSSWALKGLTNMYQAFDDARSFNAPLDTWDLSAVTNFQAMLADAWAFNQSVSAWNTSSATNMNSVFYNATSFNQPLSAWDVSRVTNFRWTFERARAFNQDLSQWNVGSADVMIGMFTGAKLFNSDLSGWNVNNVGGDGLANLLTGACSFNQDLSAWSVSVSGGDCALFASGSFLNYAQLPASCQAAAENTYTWNAGTRGSCLVT